MATRLISPGAILSPGGAPDEQELRHLPLIPPRLAFTQFQPGRSGKHGDSHFNGVTT